MQMQTEGWLLFRGPPCINLYQFAQPPIPKKLEYSKTRCFHTKSLQILIIISTEFKTFPAMGFEIAVF